MQAREQNSSDISQVSFESFFRDYPLLSYEKEERVVRPQEVLASAFCLKSGLLRVYISSSEGKEVTVAILHATQDCSMIIGFAGILDRYSVEALSPAEIWRSPKKEFSEFLKANPQLAIPLGKTMVSLIKDLFHQIELLNAGSAYERIASVLCVLGKYEGKSVESAIEIPLKLTHQRLADLTNLTRETVTTQMNVLIKQGILEYIDNTIVIKKPEILRESTIICSEAI